MKDFVFDPNDKKITEEEKIKIVLVYSDEEYPLDEEEQILEAQF